MRCLPCQKSNNWFDNNDRHFDDHEIIHMDHQNSQPFTLKLGESVNNQTNDNGPNEKLKSHYNELKSVWILKYGTTKFLPQNTNSILVEAWDACKVSSGRVIRDRYVKTKLTPSVLPT